MHNLGWNSPPPLDQQPRPIDMGQGRIPCWPGLNPIYVVSPVAAGATACWLLPNAWTLGALIAIIIAVLLALVTLSGQLVAARRELLCVGRFLGGQGCWRIARVPDIHSVTVNAHYIQKRQLWENDRWAYSVDIVLRSGRMVRVTRGDVEAYHYCLDRAEQLATWLQVPYYVPSEHTPLCARRDRRTGEIRVEPVGMMGWQTMLALAGAVAAVVVTNWM